MKEEEIEKGDCGPPTPKVFFWFCRFWTKRYLITSQTRVKRVGRIHHRTILKEYGRWCTFTRAASIVQWILRVSHTLMASTISVLGEPERVNLVVRALNPDYLLLDIFLHLRSETWTQWTIEAARVKVHHRPYSFRMVRWCIRLTRLTLVCEVIRYRLVQVRQNQKKKKSTIVLWPSVRWVQVWLGPWLYLSMSVTCTAACLFSCFYSSRQVWRDM